MANEGRTIPDEIKKKNEKRENREKKRRRGEKRKKRGEERRGERKKVGKRKKKEKKKKQKWRVYIQPPFYYFERILTYYSCHQQMQHSQFSIIDPYLSVDAQDRRLASSRMY